MRLLLQRISPPRSRTSSYGKYWSTRACIPRRDWAQRGGVPHGRGSRRGFGEVTGEDDGRSCPAPTLPREVFNGNDKGRGMPVCGRSDVSRLRDLGDNGIRGCSGESCLRLDWIGEATLPRPPVHRRFGRDRAGRESAGQAPGGGDCQRQALGCVSHHLAHGG